jgi:tetratricopeptide (TPR) repeat protein
MVAERRSRGLTTKTVFFFLIAFFALAWVAPAQQKPKQGVRDQIQEGIESLKKDIADLEKQIDRAKARNRTAEVQDLQKELETKKNVLSMMEGGMKTMERVPDKQLQDAGQGGDRSVPKKDAARIAGAPRTILTDSELKAFLLKAQGAAEKKIDPKMKTLAQQVYQSVRAKYPSVTAVANAANGCLIIGAPEAALWLMGKACTEDANPDNLNNYAAFLVMAGAEEAALPILMKLNQRFPNNSTILNNIGQAWFGLGDLEQSEKYLDGAIRLFAYHSQANYTKCLIEESKGNKTGAIEALKKSIRQSYSYQKENKLRKLGGKLAYNDIAWNFRMPQDPLGLHRFIVPRYAKNVAEAEALDPEWQKFVDDCWKRLDELKIQEKSAEAEVQKVVKERERLMKEHEEFVKGKMTSTEAIGRHRSDTLKRAATLGMALSPLGQKAMKKSQLSAQEGHYMRARKENDAKLLQTKKDIEGLRKQWKQRLDEINKKYKGGGEGSPGTPEEIVCAAREEAMNQFLVSANNLLERVQADVLTTEMRQINEDAYWRQFIEEDASFQLTKNRAKQRFLHVLLGLRHEGPHGGTGTRWVPGQVYSYKKKGEVKPAGGKLPDFDNIHCDHHIQLNMVLVKGEFTCNTAKLEYDAVIIKGEHLENLNTGKTIRGTAEVGISVGVGHGVELGPLKAEASAGVGAFVEYDERGVTDLGPRAELKGELGANLPGATIEAGVEARWGWNAGGSLGGKGILEGIHIK